LRLCNALEKWRVAVKNRDNHTCQLCGSGESVIAHHIKDTYDFPALSLDMQNGMTLCRTCHINLHHRIKLPASEKPRVYTVIDGRLTWSVI